MLTLAEQRDRSSARGMPRRCTRAQRAARFPIAAPRFKRPSPRVPAELFDSPRRAFIPLTHHCTRPSVGLSVWHEVHGLGIPYLTVIAGVTNRNVWACITHDVGHGRRLGLIRMRVRPLRCRDDVGPTTAPVALWTVQPRCERRANGRAHDLLGRGVADVSRF